MGRHGDLPLRTMFYNAAQLKQMAGARGIFPRKDRGQNFLIDKNVLENVVRHANIGAKDTVVEVGPGFGALTGELAKLAGRVIAVECDKKLAAFLRKEYAGVKNLELIEGDILKMRVPVPARYCVVANLPYRIATAVIKKFFSLPVKPARMLIFAQEEVAQRICASPPQMSVLAVSVQFYANSEIAFHVSKNCFWPVPLVGSSVLNIVSRAKPLCGIARARTFFRIVKIGFSAKRKQLKNNLKAGIKISEDAILAAFAKAGIAPNARAQELSLETWLALARELEGVL